MIVYILLRFLLYLTAGKQLQAATTVSAGKEVQLEWGDGLKRPRSLGRIGVGQGPGRVQETPFILSFLGLHCKMMGSE